MHRAAPQSERRSAGLPARLRESAMRGVVSIEGQIGTDGRMKDMRVISSLHPAFERAALDAVGEWEFTPTTLNGRVVDTRINVSVSFAPAQSPAAMPRVRSFVPPRPVPAAFNPW
ncbi:MAG: energy transducer TonB [Vicinamibacterales bacterium]